MIIYIMPKVDYDYGANIKPPMAIGMNNGSSMSAIGDNVAGILSYVKVLVDGGGPASRVGGPMGPKFFVETPTRCKDVADDKSKPRSIYLNYVPTGTLPGSFIMPSVPGIKTDYKGLLPGILANTGQLNPAQIMNTVMNDVGNSCRLLEMETIDASNNPGKGKGYVNDNDIRRMDDDWFSSTYPRPYIPPPEQEEGFEDYNSDYNSNVFRSMPDDNFKNINKLPYIYLNLLSLVGIYIVLKIMLEGKIH